MVSKQVVLRVAQLARIKLSDKEVMKFSREFSDILAYFDTIKKANLKGIKPMTHSTTSQNITREDVGKKAPIAVKNKLVAMTQLTKEGFSKVKAILE